MVIDRSLRQGLLNLHNVSVSEHLSLLERLAQLHDLFLILSPAWFNDRETYYENLCSSSPLGVSWVEALDREDRYFPVLEVLGRYILYADPPLNLLLNKEQIKEAHNRALTGVKKLMDIIY